jgi:hypothetical protein
MNNALDLCIAMSNIIGDEPKPDLEKRNSLDRNITTNLAHCFSVTFFHFFMPLDNFFIFATRAVDGFP